MLSTYHVADAMLGPGDTMEDKQAKSASSFILVGRHQYPSKGRRESGTDGDRMSWRMTREA